MLQAPAQVIESLSDSPEVEIQSSFTPGMLQGSNSAHLLFFAHHPELLLECASAMHKVAFQPFFSLVPSEGFMKCKQHMCGRNCSKLSQQS
jgi:hypothetical protein